MESEVWKDIQGFEELYQISNLGRVKSLKKSMNRKNSILILKNKTTPTGYIYVNIYKNKKCYTKYIHRLVAQYFIFNSNEYNEVNHIDGVKNNNSINNLEWCSHKFNIQHALYNGLIKTGSKNKLSVITEDQLIEINELKFFMSQKEISLKFNVSEMTISRILNKKRYVNYLK